MSIIHSCHGGMQHLAVDPSLRIPDAPASASAAHAAALQMLLEKITHLLAGLQSFWKLLVRLGAPCLSMVEDTHAKLVITQTISP